MMSPATLFGIGIVGTVFWPASPEAAIALFVSSRAWHPLAVGSVATGGQAVSLTLLFLFGNQLRARWRWFDRQCDRVQTRFGQRMERNAILVASASGLLGFPPISVSATLAPGLAPRPARLLPLMLVLRLVRFTAVAALIGVAASRWPW
jgi:hypothetical protein